jgi:hypothetical protein
MRMRRIAESAMSDMYLMKNTSPSTEMCCPKGKCGCQYFILLNKKLNHGHRGPGYF